PEAGAILHRSLTAMARGGIYDHLGGGFSRYSVDDRWLVPHFEKMLYDNALLARLYAHAWRLTGDDRLRTVSRETLDYMLRDLGLPGGGFASAEDADSEGEEGKFYAFTHEQFMEHGGERVALAARYFGVTPDGNFEGSNVLHEAATIEEVAAETGTEPAEVGAAVDAARRMLLQHRSTRVRPERDDKAITAWNGLALRALAEAGWIFTDPGYLEQARSTARFIIDRLSLPDGRLMRSRRGDRAGGPGYCDDYGAAALGMFALYQATGEPEWFDQATALTGAMVEQFADGTAGFFATSHDAERLIARPKNLYDNPTPSDNSLAAEALLHTEALSGPSDAALLDGVFRAAGRLFDHPAAAGHLLAVAATRIQEPLEIAITGNLADERALALLDEVRRHGSTGVFLASGEAGSIPLLADRPSIDGAPAAYVCRGFTCDAPVTSPGALRRALTGRPA
ncbi:thioredoxin domain-containing protein, partial [bacterium]|nr:thioredoxin domain-containing protein [bacterium]